jgi:acyl-CoA synthetase (AMP-forming)/AMP-acid ligase II
MTHQPTSLVDILRWRAKHHPHHLAYRFLLDGEFDEVVLSYEQLDRRARSIAALLQSSVKVGDRALLLFPPGLDFIVAYLGCLYAKIIAIPAYPPHPARIEISLPIIRRIVSDAGVAAVLLNTSLFDAINSRNAIRDEFSNMKLLVTDNDEMYFRAEQWQQPEIESNDIAFLQYTSGSTTTPRGVMVSHSNLIHNLGLIDKCFEISKEDHCVTWLPPYHDMGLMGGVLQAIYSGIPFTLMPHLMFLQRPLRWLQTISRFRATISGGPNFAYDLCIRKIKPEQRELLDLSSWEIAFNGAEPIYYKTLDQFADYFAPCGFRREAFMPCYGLAESTLLVVSGPRSSPPLIQHFLKKGLGQNQAIISPQRTEDTRTLVSCGQINSEQKVKIVNLETMMPCQPNEIGEIWVSGPCVASGYWDKTAENEFTFAAQLSDDNDGESYLRSGDLGFLHDGELYITGRLKNLIISEGKNHYPHDIERTVESSHSAIRPAGCAVFSILNEKCEDIIVVAELDHKLFVKNEEIIKAIREAVSVNHGLHIHDIKLTKPGDIPRTTSGKIRYFLCKKNYMASILKGIETT